jgi:amidohydrolase
MRNIFEVLEELRVNAEKSGEEVETRKIIKEYMASIKGFKEEQIGNSLIYSYTSRKQGGKVIAIRADFDAVLTDEGVYEHRCGHHGHTAILLDFANKVSEGADKDVILIFQSAEETGAGAPELIDNGFFDRYKPDIILGCHNFPGYKDNDVIIRAGNFNYSVIGFKCSLNGKPSHAAYPEHGRTPAYAVAKLVNQLEDMAANDAKISITHLKMGEHQYGTSAGNAIVLGTIRSLDDNIIGNIVKQISGTLNKLGDEYSLEVEVETSEYFKGIVNSLDITEQVKQICIDKGYPISYMEEPFRAGEDFGFYLDYTKGCYLGIGAGESHPDLHTKDYYFNNNNLKYTSKLLFDLVSELIER